MEPTYSIEDTIQSAIDRAGDAMLEVDGAEVTTLSERDRWAIYADEVRNMEDAWARLWRDLTAEG